MPRVQHRFTPHAAQGAAWCGCSEGLSVPTASGGHREQRPQSEGTAATWAGDVQGLRAGWTRCPPQSWRGQDQNKYYGRHLKGNTESWGVSLPLLGQGQAPSRAGVCASWSGTAQPAHPRSPQPAVSLLYPHSICSSAFHISTLLKIYTLPPFVLQLERNRVALSLEVGSHAEFFTVVFNCTL